MASAGYIQSNPSLESVIIKEMASVGSVWNNPSLKSVIIGNGAKITIEDKDGRSALHQAAKQGHTEVIRHLIDIGANMSAGNRCSYIIFQI
jgi:ankyrin repeat protein